jgi:hypothetical protein
LSERTKVFGIGFHKTATTSLKRALAHLGYRVTGPNGTDDGDIARNALPMCLDLAERFDGFQDNPWPLVYREMDVRYPGSKFVLTIRPTDRWIDSVVRHFGTTDTPMREWIYGVGHPAGFEDVYIERYERHNREVREHFADRPGDLLVLDITAGEGWDELSPFLGLATPDVEFPRANTARARAEKARPTALLAGKFRRAVRGLRKR